MKNTRAIWMMAVSVMLGLAVVVMASSMVSQAPGGASKVVVAAVDLELGSKLTPQMLTVIDWPQANTPTGTFANQVELQDRVLRTSVPRGDTILASKLAPVGSAGGLSAVITDGKRAMTVRVNDVVGVAGFALPGNYVDILVNAQQESGNGNETKPITKTVLERVLVLAVAQEAGRDDTKPRLVNAVTLELTPAEAEKIDLARNVGTLSLVLRNQIDKATVLTAGITKSQLFGGALMKTAVEAKRYVQRQPLVSRAVVAQPANQDCITVIQDSTRSLVCF